MAKRVAFKFERRKRKKRPGVHSKSKTSVHKSSDNYKKMYNKQGK